MGEMTVPEINRAIKDISRVAGQWLGCAGFCGGGPEGGVQVHSTARDGDAVTAALAALDDAGWDTSDLTAAEAPEGIDVRFRARQRPLRPSAGGRLRGMIPPHCGRHRAVPDRDGVLEMSWHEDGSVTVGRARPA